MKQTYATGRKKKKYFKTTVVVQNWAYEAVNRTYETESAKKGIRNRADETWHSELEKRNNADSTVFQTAKNRECAHFQSCCSTEFYLLFNVKVPVYTLYSTAYL